MQLPNWSAPLAVMLLIVTGGVAIWQRQHGRTQTTEYLWNGRRFTDGELGPMLKAFSQAKLTGYSVVDRRLCVPRREAARYLAALADAQALPRDFQSHTDAALSVTNLFESDRERQRRLDHAREKDLALAIGAMQGIENAMVQYDEIETRGFQAERLMTACVAVMPAEGHVLDRQQIATIRQMAAAAKAGLKPGEVKVTDLRSGQTWIGNQEEVALLPRAQELLELKRTVEREWEQKVRSVLTAVPVAQIVVRVDLPAHDEATSPDVAQSMEPSQMAILVALPESYLLQVWRSRASQSSARAQRSPSPDDRRHVQAQVEARVRESILAIAPRHLDMASVVTVTVIDDLAAGAAKAGWQRLATWLPQLRRSGAMPAAIGVAIIALSLAIWFRYRRSTRNDHVSTISLQSYPVAPRRDAPIGRDEPTVREDELRARLTDLVRADPDGAAQILNRWIERAG
jgi:flagellar biosynthesis/type III secretory pathway M-ring protein FliF/YscJ